MVTLLKSREIRIAGNAVTTSFANAKRLGEAH